MIGSNVTRRGMIGGLAAGVSVAAVVSSDTLIGAGVLNPREGRLFWFPAPSAGLGIGVTLQACSKSNATRFIRLHEIRTLSGAPHGRILKPNRNRPHREATHDWRDRQWRPTFQNSVRHNEFSGPGMTAGSAGGR